MYVPLFFAPEKETFFFSPLTKKKENMSSTVN